MLRVLFLSWFCLSLLAPLSPAWGDRFPQTGGETLASRQLTLPDEMKGRVSIVIVGFSKSSQNQIKEWDQRARAALGEGFDVYQVAVLEDAPRFVRGMIKSAMKGSMPAARHDRFVVVIKGQNELKKAAGFSVSDDAYVLLLDSGGEIRWRTHGSASEANLTELREQAKKLKF